MHPHCEVMMLHSFLAMFQMTKREGKTICELGSREQSERESRGLSVIPTLVLALAVATVLRRKHVFRHPLLICGMREGIESSHSCCFNSAISVRGKETRDRILPAISPITSPSPQITSPASRSHATRWQSPPLLSRPSLSPPPAHIKTSRLRRKRLGFSISSNKLHPSFY